MRTLLPTGKYRSEHAIADANYAGMRIEGILVTELLRVYREQHG